MVRHKNLTLSAGTGASRSTACPSAVLMIYTTRCLESSSLYRSELRGLPVTLRWREHIYEYGSYYGTPDGVRFARDFSSNCRLSERDGSQELLGSSKAATNEQPACQKSAASTSTRSAA